MHIYVEDIDQMIALMIIMMSNKEGGNNVISGWKKLCLGQSAINQIFSRINQYQHLLNSLTFFPSILSIAQHISLDVSQSIMYSDDYIVLLINPSYLNFVFRRIVKSVQAL